MEFCLWCKTLHLCYQVCETALQDHGFYLLLTILFILKIFVAFIVFYFLLQRLCKFLFGVLWVYELILSCEKPWSFCSLTHKLENSLPGRRKIKDPGVTLLWMLSLVKQTCWKNLCDSSFHFFPCWKGYLSKRLECNL